jgi:hypothetical protein
VSREDLRAAVTVRTGAPLSHVLLYFVVAYAISWVWGIPLAATATLSPRGATGAASMMSGLLQGPSGPTSLCWQRCCSFWNGARTRQAGPASSGRADPGPAAGKAGPSHDSRPLSGDLIVTA